MGIQLFQHWWLCLFLIHGSATEMDSKQVNLHPYADLEKTVFPQESLVGLIFEP